MGEAVVRHVRRVDFQPGHVPVHQDAQAMTYLFATPNPDFDDIRSGVQFRSGLGETDSEIVKADLLRMGYTWVNVGCDNPVIPVTPVEIVPPPEPVIEAPPLQDAEPPPEPSRKKGKRA